MYKITEIEDSFVQNDSDQIQSLGSNAKEKLMSLVKSGVREEYKTP